MIDSRAERLARLVSDYSLGLRDGDVFRIDGAHESLALVVPIYERALAAGAHPYTQIKVEGAAEQLLKVGTDEQLTYIGSTAAPELEELDALFDDLVGSEYTRAERRRPGPAEADARRAARAL